jgi:quinol monooxygenase YgiN
MTSIPYPSSAPTRADGEATEHVALPDQPDVELTMVTMAFDAVDPAALGDVLSHYVVVSRRESGCRNIDLCVSASDTRRFIIVEKWNSPEAQQRHFDSAAMVAMATACNGLLSRAPQIELLEALSAHDLA